jgi:hypothetical protein
MFASEMIGKSPVLRARDDDPADITLADGANVAVISDSSVEFYLIFDPVRGIRRRRLNACPGPLPGLGEWRGAVAFHRFVLDPVAVRRPGLRRAGVMIIGRRMLSMRFPPNGANGQQSYHLFTRVITARFFVPATMWDRPGSGRCGQHHD